MKKRIMFICVCLLFALSFFSIIVWLSTKGHLGMAINLINGFGILMMVGAVVWYIKLRTPTRYYIKKYKRTDIGEVFTTCWATNIDSDGEKDDFYLVAYTTKQNNSSKTIKYRKMSVENAEKAVLKAEGDRFNLGSENCLGLFVDCGSKQFFKLFDVPTPIPQ